MKKLLLGVILSAATVAASASTIGLSNHPLGMKKHAVTTEYNNYLNNGTGMGISAAYTRRVNDALTADAGFGFTNGDRSSKFHLGADLQIIPDYGRQPKFSLKGMAETEKFDDARINSFGVAPTLSKGFAVYGKEMFPYIALPMKISLDTDEKEYETSTAISMGASGRLPIEGIANLVGNIELNMPIRNSYTALVMGVSVPLE